MEFRFIYFSLFIFSSCSRVLDVPRVLSDDEVRREARLQLPPATVQEPLSSAGIHLRLRLRLEHAQIRTYSACCGVVSVSCTTSPQKASRK